MQIQVTNLSKNVIDADLRRIFSKYGEVNSAIIVRDKINGRSRGTALIDMPNDKQAGQAVLCLHLSVIDGMTITVTEIKYSIRDYKN